jgi:HPt (histidine-containing phosphotransfer) domain-containing protein
MTEPAAVSRRFSVKKAANLRRNPRFVNHLVIGWREFLGPNRPAPDQVIAMPLHLERIDWMPSPPLAPDDGPIDIAHLARMTLGDVSLEREVLAMFAGQSAGLVSVLATWPANAAALAHTLKGSARAIGAVRVAEAAEWLEAAMRDDADASQALAALHDSVAEARAAIDAILNRS